MASPWRPGCLAGFARWGPVVLAEVTRCVRIAQMGGMELMMDDKALPTLFPASVTSSDPHSPSQT